MERENTNPDHYSGIVLLLRQGWRRLALGISLIVTVIAAFYAVPPVIKDVLKPSTPPGLCNGTVTMDGNSAEGFNTYCSDDKSTITSSVWIAGALGFGAGCLFMFFREWDPVERYEPRTPKRRGPNPTTD